MDNGMNVTLSSSSLSTLEASESHEEVLVEPTRLSLEDQSRMILDLTAEDSFSEEFRATDSEDPPKYSPRKIKAVRKETIKKPMNLSREQLKLIQEDNLKSKKYSREELKVMQEENRQSNRRPSGLITIRESEAEDETKDQSEKQESRSLKQKTTNDISSLSREELKMMMDDRLTQARSQAILELTEASESNNLSDSQEWGSNREEYTQHESKSAGDSLETRNHVAVVSCTNGSMRYANGSVVKPSIAREELNMDEFLNAKSAARSTAKNGIHGPGAYKEAPGSEMALVGTYNDSGFLDMSFGSVGQEHLTRTEESSMIVTAIKVEEDVEAQEEIVKNQVRESLLREAVQAQVICSEGSFRRSSRNSSFWFSSTELINGGKLTRKSFQLLTIGVCILLAFALAIGLSVTLTSSSDSSLNDQDGSLVSDPTSRPDQNDESGGNDDTFVAAPKGVTLETVMDRGYVRCGVYNDMPGFSFREADGTFSGFNYELCRAVAAAALGDGDKVEPVVVTPGNRFRRLESGAIDLISQSVSISMERDVNEASTGVGFTFSYPFYYSGLMFGGIPELVSCADRMDPFNGICRMLRVCVVRGTTQETLMMSWLPGGSVVSVDSPVMTIGSFNDGACNVIAGDGITLNPVRLQKLGLKPDVNYTVGAMAWTRDPLALVTRDFDLEWSRLVNSVVKILFTAESMNLTASNVEEEIQNISELDQAYSTKVMELANRLVRVVSTVGNYGELFTREVEALYPRTGANSLNKEGGSGLFYSYPYGEVDRDVANVPLDAAKDAIMERGFLKCGIMLEAPFAQYDEETKEYSGLDVEYCRMLAAAVFIEDSMRIEYSPVTRQTGFQALANGFVDVLAGQETTLMNEFAEMTTGQIFAFTDPYFYDQDGGSRSLVTRASDNTWSSFVYWISSAPIYAEEMGWTSGNAIEMPPVAFFGDMALQCFRDAVANAGNYGEIYNRTVADVIPREGRNLRNTAPFGPQQIGNGVV